MEVTGLSINFGIWVWTLGGSASHLYVCISLQPLCGAAAPAPNEAELTSSSRPRNFEIIFHWVPQVGARICEQPCRIPLASFCLPDYS